jgi:hypothetical protein
VDTTRWLQQLRAVVDDLRAEYEQRGRGTAFDQQVEHYRAEGRWPFDD